MRMASPDQVVLLRRGRGAYASGRVPSVPLPKHTRSLRTKDGGTLRTIREACDCMTAMDKKREMRPRWQRACKFILANADGGRSRALELALSIHA
jgi:hypothetical protein